MDNLWQILSGAPWWVYVLFIILIRLGIQSFKPRTISFQRLLLFPLIFLVWSALRLSTKVELGDPSLILWWVVSISLGAYLGMLEVRHWKIHVDKHKKTITIPGNYSTVILIFAIFILNFFWGYLLATREVYPYWMLLADTVTTTVLSGFFVGRGSFFLKRYLSHK